MASRTIKCSVVSPDEAFFEGVVDQLVAPAWDGEIGILPRHAPIVARLGVGVVRLTTPDGNVAKVAIKGGILEVKNDDAKLLVSEAIRVEDVIDDDLDGRLADVIERLGSPSADEEYDQLRADRRWLETQIRLLEPAPRI